MSEEILKHDERGNIIYEKDVWGEEHSWEYDDHDNKISYCGIGSYKYWITYNYECDLIYFRNTMGDESWFRYKCDVECSITKQEYEYIEFLSRELISRFEIMEI